jgi:dienelactone hydrolase
MGIDRRKFLTGAAAGAAFSWLDSMLARAEGLLFAGNPTEAAMAATSGLSKVPRPLEDEVVDANVGSLLGPLSRMRDAAGFATESFALDKFKAADHPAWRKRMLEATLDALSYSPPRADFAAETVEKVDCGKYVREKVYFNTTPALRVPAYVLVPKDLKGKAPGIVALHDHGGFFRWGKEKLVSTPDEHPTLTAFKKECYAGRSIADDLARQGYVVICIDMFYWGERRCRLPGDPEPGKESDADVKKFNNTRGPLEQKIARRVYNAGMTWTGVMFWDDIRTVDYLVSRPEVDPGRIGCVGLSIGAFRSGHLTALDDRIKAGVECCWLTSWRDIPADNMSHTMGITRTIPGIYRLLDVPDIISLAAPRALLCINGLKDNLYPVEVGVKPSYKILETVYAKLGVPEKFRGHLYDTPHEFNEEMQKEAWEWFRRWL